MGGWGGIFLIYYIVYSFNRMNGWGGVLYNNILVIIIYNVFHSLVVGGVIIVRVVNLYNQMGFIFFLYLNNII